jgi:hypothetical protein
MFAIIVRWEIRALRRDPACWAVLALGVATVVFAMVNGARWLAHIDAVAAAAVAREATARLEAREQAARIDAKAEPAPVMTRDPRSAFGYANGLMAHYAVLPPTPLAALTAGQSDLLPSVLPLAPASLPSLAGGSEPENPRRLLVGRLVEVHCGFTNKPTRPAAPLVWPVSLACSSGSVRPGGSSLASRSVAITM